MTATTLPTARMFHEVRDGDQARLDPDRLTREAVDNVLRGGAR